MTCAHAHMPRPAPSEFWHQDTAKSFATLFPFVQAHPNLMACRAVQQRLRHSKLSRRLPAHIHNAIVRHGLKVSCNKRNHHPPWFDSQKILSLRSLGGCIRREGNHKGSRFVHRSGLDWSRRTAAQAASQSQNAWSQGGVNNAETLPVSRPNWK